MTLHTPGPWHILVYLNERDEKFAPHIVGLLDNYSVADCCGADELDLANGRLISAAPDLLEACEAAIVALSEDAPGCTPSEANRMAVKLCHAARDKAFVAS
jgi:hypothetical protein